MAFVKSNSTQCVFKLRVESYTKEKPKTKKKVISDDDEDTCEATKTSYIVPTIRYNWILIRHIESEARIFLFNSFFFFVWCVLRAVSGRM